MPIPCYLAMTATEFENISIYPKNCGWMACHFSCYSTGLSNLPTTLPAGSMVILNDRTPVYRHDPQKILEQLSEVGACLQPDCFLLDFQRADVALTRQIATLLSEKLSFPVGITADYAQDLECAVFLAPPPLHMPLEEYLKPWSGRDIWLEIAPETMDYTVTEEGCSISASKMRPLPTPAFAEEPACSRYHIELQEDKAVFTLQRAERELETLMARAETLGVSRVVGLYQQLKDFERNRAER